MLKECLEVFKSDLENKQKEIIDAYVPVPGTYVIVKPKDGSFEIKDYFDIKLDKKTKELSGKTNSNFYNICNYDYNSIIFGTNKPMARGKFVNKKIIHSNNYLSFFVKKESLTNGKLTNDVIDNYYETLENPYLKYTGKSKEIYELVEKEIGKVDVNKVQKIKEWITENIFDLGIELTGKDYLKIFFEYPLEEYVREGKRYTIPNIYNSNDYNIELDNIIYGLPNNNMGLNSKKPYLENKTRKNTLPYLLNIEEVQLQKEFFDYLINEVSVGKLNIFIDMDQKNIYPCADGDLPNTDFENGLFLRLMKGFEVEIHNFDTIVSYKMKLRKSLDMKNILGLNLEKAPNQKYGLIKDKKVLQNVLDEVFFNKCLIHNYFTDAGNISIRDNILKTNLLLARDSIFNWIYKGIENNYGVAAVLDKVSLNLIKGSINNGYGMKAGYQFNLRWALKEYFGGEENMADIIQEVKESLRNKVKESSTGKIDNDKEYYFAIGQLVNYLLSKSRGKKKPHSLANQFINSKSNDDIKEKLRKLYIKYSYDLETKGKRFNNLYAMILGYVPEGKVNNDLLIAGYLNSSLIYEKNSENSNGGTK